jgi:hypothetical protein
MLESQAMTPTFFFLATNACVAALGSKRHLGATTLGV